VFVCLQGRSGRVREEEEDEEEEEEEEVVLCTFYNKQGTWSIGLSSL
jgi:hypothetical protein